MKNYVILILSIILGTTFIVSSFLKLYPIEPFEMYFYSYELFNWDVATILVRFLIGFEISLGVLILSFWKRRFVIYIALSVLIIFSGLLIFQTIFTGDENCFCFGDALPMTPVQSLIKNIVLIVISAVLLRKGDKIQFQYQNIIVPTAATVLLMLPFVLNPPDAWVKDSLKKLSIENKNFPVEKIQPYMETSVDDGKKILCFYSMKCKFCKMAASKLSIIDDRLAKDLPITYFFFGDETDMNSFWEGSKSNHYPYAVIPIPLFFEVSDKSLPTIYFIEDGKIVKKLGYRTLFEDDVIEFFKEK